MDRFRAPKREWLRSSSVPGVLAAAVAAAALTAYAGAYFASASTTTSDHHTVHLTFIERVESLGWTNLVLVLAVVATGVQVIASRRRESHLEDSGRDDGRLMTIEALKAAVSLLKSRKADTEYRALVTVPDYRNQTRKTLCGANIKPHPEYEGSVPLGFGVTGVCYLNKIASWGDIDDSTRASLPDGSVLSHIWPEIASVIAFPMLTRGGEVFGTVGFDSNKPLTESALADPHVRKALDHIAVLTAHLLRGYSPDGTAHDPY